MKECIGCTKKSFLGHDYCFSNIPNAVFACCGHGNIQNTYIVFRNSDTLNGKLAFEWVREHRPRVCDVVKIYLREVHLITKAKLFVLGSRLANTLGFRLIGCVDIGTNKSHYELQRN